MWPLLIENLTPLKILSAFGNGGDEVGRACVFGGVPPWPSREGTHPTTSRRWGSTKTFIPATREIATRAYACEDLKGATLPSLPSVAQPRAPDTQDACGGNGCSETVPNSPDALSCDGPATKADWSPPQRRVIRCANPRQRRLLKGPFQPSRYVPLGWHLRDVPDDPGASGRDTPERAQIRGDDCPSADKSHVVPISSGFLSFGDE